MLFDCHEQLSTGAEFFAPDRQTVVDNSMAGYVDDTKCITNDMNQTCLSYTPDTADAEETLECEFVYHIIPYITSYVIVLRE